MHRQINNNKRCQAKEASVFLKYGADAPLVALFPAAEHSQVGISMYKSLFVVIDATCHESILQVLWRTIWQPYDFLNITIHCSWLKIKHEFIIDLSRAERRQNSELFAWAPSLPLLKPQPLLLCGRVCVFTKSVWLIIHCTEMMNDRTRAAFMESPRFCLKYLRLEVSSLNHPVWIFFSFLQHSYEALNLLWSDYGDRKRERLKEQQMKAKSWWNKNTISNSFGFTPVAHTHTYITQLLSLTFLANSNLNLNLQTRS